MKRAPQDKQRRLKQHKAGKTNSRSARLREESARRKSSPATSALLTPRQAAARLSISYPTVKQWLYRGKLLAIKTPGGHYRISSEVIEAMLAQSRGEPPAAVRFGISGRNKLIGTIVEIRMDGLMAQVRLDIAGQILTSIITSEAVRELALKAGQQAGALIKSTEVMILRV